MDSGLSHRTRKSRTAEVCRLCLQQRYLVNINANQYLGMQLKECFPQTLLDDKELPQFVCGECYQLVDITYQFSVRMRRTEVLLRTYVHMGGDFPEPAMLEAVYQGTAKRSASPEREDVYEPPVKKRVSWETYSKTSKKDPKYAEKDDQPRSKYTEKERKPSKHSEKDQTRKDSKHTEKEGHRSKDRTSSKHGTKDRKSSKHAEKLRTDNKASEKRSNSTKDQERGYYKSDKFLFGEAVDTNRDGKRNDSTEETTNDAAAARPEIAATNLTGMNLKMSYEDMLNALQTIQNIENKQLKAISGPMTYVDV
ncbi:luc7-like protein 3 [Armigeres subalbatus]|uniref:luc7-like protein 3 n=1 Tax=Armigeres subalbatus TaxID=124917 RepID=UPI002ED13A00